MISAKSEHLQDLYKDASTKLKFRDIFDWKKLSPELSARAVELGTLILEYSRQLESLDHVLLVLQAVQILHFSISKLVPNLWDFQLFKYLQMLASFVNLLPNQSSSEVSVARKLVYTSFWFNFAILVIGLVCLFKLKLRKDTFVSLPLSITFKFIAFYTLCARRILTIPFAQTSYAVLFCASESNDGIWCSFDSDRTESVTAILNLLFIYILILLFHGIELDRSPMSSNSFACFPSPLEKCRTLVYTLVPFYLLADPTVTERVT